MKNITLLRSVKDLAASKADQLCSQDKPYYTKLLDVMETKVVDDLIESAIEAENARRVKPVLCSYIENHSEVPIPFEIDGKTVSRIRNADYWLEVSFGDADWRHLSDKNMIRLYESLDEAGCLNELE